MRRRRGHYSFRHLEVDFRRAHFLYKLLWKKKNSPKIKASESNPHRINFKWMAEKQLAVGCRLYHLFIEGCTFVTKAFYTTITINYVIVGTITRFIV